MPALLAGAMIQQPEEDGAHRGLFPGPFGFKCGQVRIILLDGLVVGLELQVDPFIRGDIIYWVATGTAAKLEPLF